jgi:hypothetical protein
MAEGQALDLVVVVFQQAFAVDPRHIQNNDVHLVLLLLGWRRGRETAP